MVFRPSRVCLPNREWYRKYYEAREPKPREEIRLLGILVTNFTF